MDNKNTLHSYDGIEEQNNPMPDWWIWLFIFTIIFGFIYWIHYASGSGPTLVQEYEVALQEYQTKVEAQANKAIVETEESLMNYMKNENFILTGGKIYAEKCSMCHGAELEGKIGPNLTDQYWINGKGSRLDVVNLIAKGSAAKGMPPWEGLLKNNEIKNVAAFVYSKIGTNPTGAKAPEGEKH